VDGRVVAASATGGGRDGLGRVMPSIFAVVSREGLRVGRPVQSRDGTTTEEDVRRGRANRIVFTFIQLVGVAVVVRHHGS